MAAPAIAEIKAGGASIPKYGSSIGKGVAGKGGSTAQTQVQGVNDVNNFVGWLFLYFWNIIFIF